MLYCPRCRQKSSIITAPTSHQICPLCGEGELIPVQFENTMDFNKYMAQIDKANHEFLAKVESAMLNKKLMTGSYGYHRIEPEDFSKN